MCCKNPGRLPGASAESGWTMPALSSDAVMSRTACLFGSSTGHWTPVNDLLKSGMLNRRVYESRDRRGMAGVSRVRVSAGLTTWSAKSPPSSRVRPVPQADPEPKRRERPDALTGQSANRDFPQNLAHLSRRRRLCGDSALRKRRKTAPFSPSGVGFAEVRDWMVESIKRKPATTVMVRTRDNTMVLATHLASRDFLSMVREKRPAARIGRALSPRWRDAIVCVGDRLRRGARSVEGLRAPKAFHQRGKARGPVSRQQGKGVHRFSGRDICRGT